MKNFTFKMLSFLLLGFIGITTYAQEWNFSSATFSALGTVAETKTIEGLTIYGVSGAEVVVDANNKTLDGISFTSRLKLGGTGNFDADGKPVSRVLAFSVTGNTTITVMGMSSSSGSDRTLVIAAGKKETEVGRFAALGASISKGEFTYTGEPTTIYLFSPSSGVNLYYVKATSMTSGLNNQVIPEFKVFPNPASGKVFINVNESSEIGIYNIAGSLIKQQMVTSSRNTINISDLHSGIYFVKMMKNIGLTQKLIIL
jgi:hypothetical protein